MYGHQKQGIMTLEEAQKEVDRWIKTYGVRYFSELTNMAVLTEEVGELARVMARKYGDQSFKQGEKDNLADEMADVLWVLICLANQTGVNLTEAFRQNLEKKTNRDKDRHKTTPNYKELWNIITNSKVDMNIVMTTIMDPSTVSTRKHLPSITSVCAMRM